ncbi:hypothetical protein Bca52824_004764 [Brassica carinata]|uniref:Uncharacterized protein n=1 Tax=Brassica carinata TaxID=52824 RepID=A0A8X7WM89_BRACI|nr:hypothetical protein Bca52824_004764 [Brassica carinata]
MVFKVYDQDANDEIKLNNNIVIRGDNWRFSDMIRHLRKSIHCSLDDSTLGYETIQYNLNFETAVEQCLVQLYHRSDAGPILDIMAVMLESMSNFTVMARTQTAAVPFPDALFHQLLQAMVCADHESRMGVHRIFSVVLVPSSVCPDSVPKSRRPADMQWTLSRTVSVFFSSAALFRKLKMESDNGVDDTAKIERESQHLAGHSQISQEVKYVSYLCLFYNSDESFIIFAYNWFCVSFQVIPLRLSSHQIYLLLSSIWVQSLSPHNMPQNCEAIANTYSFVLLFGRTKNSSNEVLVWSFQLAFSWRNLSLGGSLQPSRRRSLFTLATSMIIFSARAFNIPHLVDSAKTALQEKTTRFFNWWKILVDALFYGQEEQPGKSYGSKEEDEDALIQFTCGYRRNYTKST